MADAPGFVKSALFSDSAPISGCAVTPDVILPLTNIFGPRIPDRVTGGQFILGQNYPNPYKGETNVPFTLANSADVRLNILDLMGRKVAGVVRKGCSAGAQSIRLNLTGIGLPPGDYVYELQVTTRQGVYRQSMLMTTE
ncbi:T9SS type A sorting domain-containing protein [Hymenobacter negativus]|uniref:T9SS type A sorting domain-containing protein n=1 Tax=Hymenobacter negativus TaxID=2795026 RepID=A0ABS3QFJ2_9BACT|nr:T9SS type A sorting domain-containing protein [Hymenobacter negativus]MBO2010037.1 T9SS type A sorting domain-containing protein [Hymenobacter negativus]